MGGRDRGIRLSEKHGVNPMVTKCYVCLEDIGVALLGRLKGDVEAPRSGVIDFEPCDKCKGHMEQAVILISIDPDKSDKDDQNPYRTGGWVVMAEQWVHRVLPKPIAEDLLKRRVAFVPDADWDALGLPRGEVDGKDGG